MQQTQQIPVEIVGSSTFGIYPKIGIEHTYNMFITNGSDGRSWMMNYPGYRKLNNQFVGNQGRGIFYSIRGNFVLVVEDDSVYKLNDTFGATLVGQINTNRGEVFMDENLSRQICIVDGNNAWIYNYEEESFTVQNLDVGFDVVPGYVSYINSFFLIAPSVNDPNNTFNWYAFQYASPTTIEHVTFSSFPLQTKPDNCLAVKRLPGKGNNVIVFGSTVCEVWTQVGGQENFRRNSSFNIDYGCVSISTIAADDRFVCFLSKNERSSPRIVYTDGSQVVHISTDGIDNLLADVQFPEQSTAFFHRQDGHLFYQITFYNPADNFTLAYDFNTQKFFDITDENMNYHPARQAVYFNGKTIFIGINSGSVFDFSTDINGAYYTRYGNDGYQIPRIRISNTLRIPNSKPFFVKQFEFMLENGVGTPSGALQESITCVNTYITEDGLQDYISSDGEVYLQEDGYCINEPIDWPRVDMSFSTDGNQTFSNIVGIDMNPEGNYRTRMRWFRLGQANEWCVQLRFWGLNRFVISDGFAEIAA